MTPPYDWKVSKDKKNLTVLQVLDPNGKTLITGTGEDIWAARESALAKRADLGLQNYITTHIFPDAD